jgi:hypothetical protein
MPYKHIDQAQQCDTLRSLDTPKHILNSDRLVGQQHYMRLTHSLGTVLDQTMVHVLATMSEL